MRGTCSAAVAAFGLLGAGCEQGMPGLGVLVRDAGEDAHGAAAAALPVACSR